MVHVYPNKIIEKKISNNEKKHKPNSTTELQAFGVSVPVIDKNKQKSFLCNCLIQYTLKLRK